MSIRNCCLAERSKRLGRKAMALLMARSMNEQASEYDQIKASEFGWRRQCKLVHTSDEAVGDLGAMHLSWSSQGRAVSSVSATENRRGRGASPSPQRPGSLTQIRRTEGMLGRDVVAGLSGKVGATSTTRQPPRHRPGSRSSWSAACSRRPRNSSPVASPALRNTIAASLALRVVGSQQDRSTTRPWP